MSYSVGGGYNWGSANNANQIRYRGDNSGLSGGGPLNTLLLGGLQDYLNSGALSDMLLGGAGFGQSRRYRQYDPFDPYYGYMPRSEGGRAPGTGNPENQIPPGDDGGGGAPLPGGDQFNKATVNSGMNNVAGVPSTTPPPSSAKGGYDPNVGHPVYNGPQGPGQQPLPEGANPDDWYNYPWTGNGDESYNDQWWQHDEAPVEGQGLLGEVAGLGKQNDIDARLKNDLGWQSTGDLMDLEMRGLTGLENYGKQNWNEKATDDMANWFRGGELSGLEQTGLNAYKNYGNATDLEGEVGNSWRGVAGPGEYDPLRGKTLTDLVGSKGFSTDERAKMMGSSLLPIQQALEAQKLEGDARQAATGNAAGRWGASNAMALNAAGQASQAARDIDLASANMARQERAQGLEGLSGLQNQIDQRKVQGASGLQGLSGQQRQAQLASVQGQNQAAQDQRQNQLAGMNTAMQSNAQQRAAQLASTQGIGQMGQNQRANTQWGLQNLGAFNEQQKQNALAGYGARKDMYDTVKGAGDTAANRAAQLASLAAGSQDSSSQSGGSAAVSV